MSMTIHSNKLEYLAHSLRKMTGDKTNKQHRRLVNQALSRINSETYGYCMVCGMNIPERELELKPERQCCSGCEGNEDN